MPFSSKAYYRHAARHLRLQLACVGFLVVACGLAFTQATLPTWIYYFFGRGSAVAVVLLIGVSGHRNRYLRVIKYYGDYLWIEGAEEAFLRRLPLWHDRVG